jgi:hypothetical protein
VSRRREAGVHERTIRLSQLGRARRWAEDVAATGEPLAVVDDAGQELAWLIPATESLTEELLSEIAARLVDDEARETFRAWTEGLAGNPAFVYHRPSGTIRSQR